MSEQEDHSLSKTPTDVAIKALQRQVEQLKRIVNKTDVGYEKGSEKDVQELLEHITKLETANAKAEYRINILLRTLREKEK